MRMEGHSGLHDLGALRAERSADETRFIGYSRVLYISALIGHLCFLIAFYLLGQTVMCLFNILSVAVFTFGTFWAERGHMRLALALGMTEVTVHAFLATLYMGWGTGFYLYIFSNMSVVWLTPFYSLRVKIVISFALLGTLLGLFALSKVTGELQPIEPWIAEVFLVLNWTYFAFLACIGLYGLGHAIKVTEAALQTEVAKSEFLLQNILPTEIIDRLKQDPDTISIAQDFTDVTILFADIVGFTEFSSGRDPAVVVERLNVVFSLLDSLTESHRLEKIKTIGDSYMVVGGLPTPRRDHATAVAQLGLDILAAMKELDGTEKTIRIGINSGPVVAGVIGKKKFAYDLWGDAVNIAARMEAYSEPGRILVSAATRSLIDETFVCEGRGVIEIKGKGAMETFFLEGRK